MAGRPVTRELYDNLVKGFREMPGNASFAARRAGCKWRMAARGWEHGWSPRVPWAIPIKEVLRQEGEEEQRRKRQESDERVRVAAMERDRTRTEAVDALREEGQMLKAGRISALNCLASAATLLPAVKLVAESLRDRITKGEQLPLAQAMNFLNRYSTMVRSLSSSAQLLIEAERSSRGEPSKIIGVQAIESAYSPEEAAREIEEANELVQLARERGFIGGGEPIIDEEPDPSPESNGGTNGAVH